MPAVAALLRWFAFGGFTYFLGTGVLDFSSDGKKEPTPWWVLPLIIVSVVGALFVWVWRRSKK